MSLTSLLNSISRRRNALLGGVVIALALAHVVYFFPRTVDDLFISLRYAENLAHGKGAVYNAGEKVEGYSGPSWMILQAIAIACGFEPVTFMKLVGIGFLIATLLGLRSITREVYGVEGWCSWIPSLVCAVNPYVIAWTILGLETPLHLAAIVLCPLAIHRALVRDGGAKRKSIVIAVLAIVMLGTSRPESALYLVASFVAPFARVRTIAAAKSVLRRMKWIALPSIAILIIALAIRFAYYGDLVPNTYHVKGASSGFDIAKLAQLWREGALPLEAGLYCGGTLLLTWLAFGLIRKARSEDEEKTDNDEITMAAAPVLSIWLCLYFTASVASDWMPSLRHLLPVTILAPIAPAILTSRFLAFEGNMRLCGFVVLGFITPTMGHLATIDVRMSEIEYQSVWMVRKSSAKWGDVVLSYKRIEPPHVTKMDRYEMGQIAQMWPIFETSAEPIDEQWYAGRDIGALGFYTGVRVFDTAGLTNTIVSRSDAWTKRGEVTDDLVRAMMDKRPVAGDIYDGWDDALGRNPSLFVASYRVRHGDEKAPKSFVATDRAPPSEAEIERRYRAFLAKLPQAYHLHTLYGEAMGAAALRRVRIKYGGVVR